MHSSLHSRACRLTSSQPQKGLRRFSTRSPGRGLPFRVLASAIKEKTELFSNLEVACKEFKRAPPSEKYEYTADIMEAMKALKEANAISKWGAALDPPLERRNVFQGELKKVGVKTPGSIAVPTVRNERAFLVTVVGTTSVLAVAAGQLPGDWGFFSAYLIGGLSIAVLAIGSTAPGLLSFFINKFSTIFPDYYERVLGHEAAHFLAGYLLGVPVSAYSLDIGRAHTDFAESKLQQRLIERQLTDDEINQLAVISMAGIAGEARQYDEIQGQTADLSDLQRILNRSQNKLSNSQQQNMTRWAVYNACTLLQEYEKEYKALQKAMRQGKSIPECVAAIEQA